MDQHGQTVFESERREREVLSHEVDVSCVYEFSCRTQSLVAVVTFHLREISSDVAPLPAIQTIEEVMHAQVVQDHDSRMAPAHLPDRGMEEMVVADVVEGYVRLV